MRRTPTETWHDLESLSPRLEGPSEQIVYWVRWTEADNSLVLLNANGQEQQGGTLGSGTLLKSDLVIMALRDARVQGSGPTGPSVTLTLPLIFTTSAANTVFTVEVSARDDAGDEEPFADAATITIGAASAGPQPRNPSNDGGDRVRPDRPRKLTEEQVQQHQHTNMAGLDEYRAEGNVTEVHTDADPPYVVIGTRDGLVVLHLQRDATTVKVRIGDYVKAEGEKVTEQLYEIESLSTR